jgi:SAM-dependent methyltransferase
VTEEPPGPTFRSWLAAAPVPEAFRRLVPNAVKDRISGRVDAPVEEPVEEPAPTTIVDARAPLEPGMVDVDELLRTLSVERLAEAADDYFRSNLDERGYYFIKPFRGVDEAPDHLVAFAQLVAGLRPLPGMRILDFGAGSCWSTRLLTQMRCAVTAVDVSETALELGRELLRRLPIVGEHHPPEYLHFDGRRLPVEDGSIDRIFCFDAFHHVPNPQEVLGEFGRVLRDGGVAGFNEPGPNHSRTPQSQFEMRNYTVVENDILMREIWKWAEEAGFTRLELSLFDTRSHRVDLDTFDDFLLGGDAVRDYGHRVQEFLGWRRMFFLAKGDAPVSDSRGRDGLAGQVTAVLESTTVRTGQPIRGEVVVSNIGTARWLPSTAPVGGVKVGVHLYDADGRLLYRDFGRIELPGDGIEPGRESATRFELPSPSPGRYSLELDLVSEQVCWFEINGARPVAFAIEVG